MVCNLVFMYKEYEFSIGFIQKTIILATLLFRRIKIYESAVYVYGPK